MKVTDKIIEDNLRFIYRECLKVSNPSRGNWDDIKQEGTIAFCKAYEQYDEDKDVKGFYYYASKYIRLYLLHYIDTKCSIIHYSKKVRNAVYTVRKEKQEGKSTEAIMKKLKFNNTDRVEYSAFVLERNNKGLYLSDVINDNQSDDREISYDERLIDNWWEDRFNDMVFKLDFKRIVDEFENIKCLELYEDKVKLEVAKRLLRGVISGKEESQKKLAEQYNLSCSMVNRLRKNVLTEFQNVLKKEGLLF